MFKPLRLHDALPAARPVRTAARGLGLGLAALALAAGSVAASTETPRDPGTIVQAVGSKTATVYTSVHDWNHVAQTGVPVGVRVHPAFVVTGSDGTPTGKATVQFYSDSSCTVPELGWAATLPANATVDNSTYNDISTTATTKSVQVTYQGDATYAAAVGPCRSITFTKIDPTVTTEVLDWNGDVTTSVPFNQQVSARVTVAGTLGVPSGLVVVRGWANATCDGSDYEYTSKNLDGAGVADDVLTLTFDAPSMRSYRAHYAGNGTYNGRWSDCVAVEGTKIDAGLTFVLHDAGHNVAQTPLVLGSSVHALAGVTGQGGQPTGTMTIHVYTGKDCQTQAYEQPTPAVASLDDGNFGKAFPGAPGYISWKLTYSGDAKYKAESSVCVSRQFLAHANLTIAVHDADHAPVTSIVLGDKVHLSVSVSGDFGAITGNVYLQADETGACSSGASFASTSLVGGSSDNASLTFKPHAVETVWFRASYPGDGSTYGYSTSACVPVEVKPAPATPAPGATATPAPTATPVETTPGSTPAAGSTDDPSAPIATTGPTASPTSQPSAPGSPAPTAPGPTSAPAAGGPVTRDSGSTGGGSTIGIAVLGVLGLGVGIALWFAFGRHRKRQALAGAERQPLSVARPS